MGLGLPLVGRSGSTKSIEMMLLDKHKEDGGCGNRRSVIAVVMVGGVKHIDSEQTSVVTEKRVTFKSVRYPFLATAKNNSVKLDFLKGKIKG